MEIQARVKERCESTDVDQARVESVHERLMDEPTVTRLAQIFKALSDPTRVRILSALSQNELCVHELAACLGVSQSAVSHQLRTLREMCLVLFRKQGRHVHYSLDDEHICALFRCGLEHVEHD